MDLLLIEIAVSAWDLVLSISITNQSGRPLLIGGLNEWNVHVNPVDPGTPSVKPWLQSFPGPKNADGVQQVGEGESTRLTYKIAEEREFFAVGIYRAGVSYDSRGYQERFKGAKHKCFHMLATLEPILSLSNIVEFIVTEELLAENRRFLNERRRVFWDRAPK